MATHTIWSKSSYVVAFLCILLMDYAACQDTTGSSTDPNQKWIIAIALLASMLGLLVLALGCIIIYFCCYRNNNLGGQGYGPAYPTYQAPPPPQSMMPIQPQQANIYRMKPTGFWGAPALVDASFTSPYAYNNGGYGGGGSLPSPYGGGGLSPYGGPRNYY